MYNDNVDRDPDSCIGSHAKLWLYYIISSILFSRNKQTSQPTCNMKTLLLTSFVSGQAAFGIQFLCQQWEQFSSLRNNGIKIQQCLKSLSSSSSSSSSPSTSTRQVAQGLWLRVAASDPVWGIKEELKEELDRIMSPGRRDPESMGNPTGSVWEFEINFTITCKCDFWIPLVSQVLRFVEVPGHTRCSDQGLW